MYKQYQKIILHILFTVLLLLPHPVLAKGEGQGYREDINGYRIHDQGNYRENSWRYKDGKRSGQEQSAKEKQNSKMKGKLPGKIFFQGSDSGSLQRKRGIDVSRHQGTIDWNQAKNEIDFAILRCGYGGNLLSQDDTMFVRNASQCTQLGIPFGVYLYSYAENTEEAVSEAQHVLRLIQGYHLDFPVYYDLEDELVGRCSNATIEAMAETFCTIISDAGYEAGVYASKYWWDTKLTAPSYQKWQRWVAQWASACTYTGSYRMWQYTSSGRVSGISSNVDMDYWFEKEVNGVAPPSSGDTGNPGVTAPDSGNTEDPDPTAPSEPLLPQEPTGTKDLSKGNLLLSSYNMVYAGQPCTPSVTVLYEGKKLTQERDYILAYESNNAPGAGKVKAIGINDYSGVLEETFSIQPTKIDSGKPGGTANPGGTASPGGTANSGAAKEPSTTSPVHQHTYKTVKTVRSTYISEGYTLKQCDCGETAKTDRKARLVLKSPAVKAATGKKKAVFSWRKIKGASGYKIYMKASPKGKYKCIKTLKTVRFTKTKLISKKKYYFAIKAYKKVSGRTVYSKPVYKTLKVK